MALKEGTVRAWFWSVSVVTLVAIAIAGAFWSPVFVLYVVTVPLFLLGLWDCLQTDHTILRNFPVIGHVRYALEAIRPEIQQYFIESNIDAHPIEREYRAVVYQRAKGELDTKPFGTERDVYAIGYEWAAPSLAAKPPAEEVPRIEIGGEACSRPYSASLLNVSAMSFGSLSGPALVALNRGAKAGGFAHNTGEGGISEHHLQGGDLIWQIGTGYFGCRRPDGGFDVERFRDEAARESVRMIELKLSQGAKPGHGGVLPGPKVTPEIARVRGVEPWKTVLSPPGHREFDTPIGLLEFLARLREASGGKPTGFKICLGRRSDFFAILKAMRETGIRPDFITVDGGEGGTGAAPLEFSNALGMPARDAWMFAHTVLVGASLRDDIKLIAAGKILTGFHMVRALAIGADLCVSARGMMFAIGCIQALRCHSDHCPTGVATQNPRLTKGLVVADKAERAARFHDGTVHSFLELLGAMGLDHPHELAPHHIFRRIDDLRIRHFGELYDYLEPGQLLEGGALPDGIADEWKQARADRFTHAPEAGPHGGARMR